MKRFVEGHDRSQGALFPDRLEDWIDDDNLGVALFACLDGVVHDVDLGRRRVGSPNDDQIRFRHLARIDALQLSRAGFESEPRHVDANGGVKQGIFLGMAKAVDAVAHQKAHGAGKIVRPHRFRAMALLGTQESVANLVERRLPRNRAERTVTLGAAALQRLAQATGMVQPSAT